MEETRRGTRKRLGVGEDTEGVPDWGVGEGAKIAPAAKYRSGGRPTNNGT